MHAHIGALKDKPLLCPPPDRTDEWMAPRAGDLKAMKAEAERLRYNTDEGDRGYKLLRLNYAMNKLGLPSIATPEDRSIAEDELRECRLDSKSGELVAAFIFRMNALSWEQQFTEADKKKLKRSLLMLQGSDDAFEVLRAHYFAHEVGQHVELHPSQEKKLLAYLANMRDKEEKGLARILHMLGTIGLPQHVSPKDITLMRRDLENVRREGFGWEIAEDLYFLSRLPVKSEASMHPPLPALRRLS